MLTHEEVERTPYSPITPNIICGTLQVEARSVQEVVHPLLCLSSGQEKLQDCKMQSKLTLHSASVLK